MLKKAFPDGIGISRKVAVVNITLVANAFIWYFYVSKFLMEVIDNVNFSHFEVLMILGINVLGIATSAIFSSSLIYKFKRRMSFLLYWMLAGVILSLTPIAINIATYIGLITVSAVLGVYFGIGMPICMGYFAATTEVENRARLGGITFLLTGLSFFILSSIGSNDILFTVLILAVLRAVGLVLLVFLKPEEKQIGKNDKMSYGFVASNKSFLLYFIPWCMFSLVNYLAVPVNNKFFPEEFVYYSTVIENILAGISAVFCGFFADYVGRKRLTVVGFVLLGLGYAVLGLSQQGNVLGWWFYTFVDGIAWGTFCTVFIITLWGDLAQERSSEKYYAIGGLPFLFSNFLRLSIGAYVAAEISEYATIFSFASVFLFLAVLPLIYAPETLPEKKIRERELKKYIEKAKKAKEKYA